MALDSRKILIGLFSYNEGENLKEMFEEVKRQSIKLNCRIVLLDESDEPKSLALVNEIMREESVINLVKGNVRRGKVFGYNLLYEYFVKYGYDILLHFDVDHELSDQVVPSLCRSIDSGFDVITCLNKPLKPKNLFQRLQYVMTKPATSQRENGTFNFPLVGHNGAYSLRAVKVIGNIPTGGIDEEIYVLSKVLANNLSYTIVNAAISYFNLPGTLSDYIQSTRRVYGKVKAFNNWYCNSKVIINLSEPKQMEKRIYSFPPLKLLVNSLFSDPIASLFLPFILIVRWTVMRSAKIYDSDTWETIETTKFLKERNI
jgi:hypothetical protein